MGSVQDFISLSHVGLFKRRYECIYYSSYNQFVLNCSTFLRVFLHLHYVIVLTVIGHNWVLP
jgi:hypothetical protein